MSESIWLLVTVFAAGLASLGFAAWPLRRSTVAPMGRRAGRGDEVGARKAAALVSLRDLERDYQLGSLEESDYRALRQEQEGHALRALKAEDAEAEALEQAIALELQRARARLKQVGSCPSCGRAAGKADRFCAGCGALLTAVVYAPAPASPEPAVAPNGAARHSTALPGTALPQAPAPSHPAPLAKWARTRRVFYLVGAAVMALAFSAGTVWLVLGAPARTQQKPFALLPAPGVGALAVGAGSTGRVLAAADAGLIASSDAARTWQRLEGPGGAVVSLTVSGGPGGAVYAAGPGLLARSEDGGQTWVQLAGALPLGQRRTLAADPRVPGRLYAMVGPGLFRSDDAGATWRPLAGQSLAAETTALVVVPAGPDTAGLLFAGTLGAGVIASADEGATWSNANGFVNGALPTATIRSLAYDPQSGDRFEGVGGSRFTGALYAGTDMGLFKNTDGGASWNRLPLQAQVVVVAVNPAEPRVVLVVDDQGRLFRSEDGGLTWPG